MPFKQFVDGERLTQADVDKYWVQQIHAVKAADETVVSSTTMQNDDHLSISVLASSDYWLEIFLIYDAIQAADIKIDFTTPASSTLLWMQGSLPLSATATTAAVSRTALTTASVAQVGGPAVGAGTNAIVMGEGRLTTAGTAGTLQMRWAQNTSSATGTIMRANSLLILQKLTV